MLDLDIRHLDAPGIRLLIEDLLDIRVEPVAFREHFVEFVLAQHRAQRGLGQLAGGRHEVLDLDDRPLGIDDPKIQDRIDLHRDIVARDDVLGRYVLHDDPQIDPHHLLDERDQDAIRPRSLTPVKRPSVNTTPRWYSRTRGCGGKEGHHERSEEA